MKIYYQTPVIKYNPNFKASPDVEMNMKFNKILRTYPDINQAYQDLLKYIETSGDQAGIIYNTKRQNLTTLLHRKKHPEFIPVLNTLLESFKEKRKTGLILDDEPWSLLNEKPFEFGEIALGHAQPVETLNKDAQLIAKALHKKADPPPKTHEKTKVFPYVNREQEIKSSNEHYIGIKTTEKHIIPADTAREMCEINPQDVKTRRDLHTYMSRHAKSNANSVNYMLNKYDALLITDKVYEFLVVKHLIEQNRKINAALAKAVTNYMEHAITKKLGNPRSDSFEMMKNQDYSQAVSTVFRYFLTDLLKFAGLSFDGIKMNYSQLKENSQKSLAAAVRAKGIKAEDEEIRFYYRTIGRILKNLNIPFNEKEYLQDLQKRISRFSS